jgi:hypothetical protein
MIKVELQLKTRIPFWTKKVQKDMPQNWDELSPRDFIYLSNLFLTKQTFSNYDREKICNQMLCVQSPLKGFPESVIRLTDFVFEMDDPIEKVFISQFYAGKQFLFGPTDGLQNVRFGEFCCADTFYMMYYKDKSEHFLSKFIACLYRPAPAKGANWDNSIYNPKSHNYQGDVRERFNDNVLLDRMRNIDKASDQLRRAIGFNYHMLHNALEKRYPYVFNPEYQPQRTTIKLGNKDQASNWDTVIRTLCQGDISRIGKISNEWMHNVLAELNDTIKKSIENDRN